MYQPRRVSEAVSSSHDGAAAFVVAPRRAARSRSDVLRTRVAPTAISVALLATSGAFALSLRATEGANSAVPAPVREAETVSRDTARELVSTDEVADEESPAAEAPAAEAGTAETPAAEAPAAEAPAAEAPADSVDVVVSEGDAAFVGGQWAAAFGTAAGSKFAQKDSVVRAQASGEAAQLGKLKAGDKISVTDKVEGSFRQVAFDGKVGWVQDSRLGDEAPKQEAPKQEASKTKATSTKASSGSGSGSTEAASGSSAKSEAKSESKSEAGESAKYDGPRTYTGKTVLGLKPKAMVVYNAVTARWSFASIGGYRANNNRSNHGRGGAIDFMTYKDSAKGWAVAKYLAANASEFQIDHIIFEQKIWTPYKPYWRPMANRGSITANHYDHVHVSVKL